MSSCVIPQISRCWDRPPSHTEALVMKQVRNYSVRVKHENCTQLKRSVSEIVPSNHDASSSRHQRSISDESTTSQRRKAQYRVGYCVSCKCINDKQYIPYIRYHYLRGVNTNLRQGSSNLPLLADRIAMSWQLKVVLPLLQYYPTPPV